MFPTIGDGPPRHVHARPDRRIDYPDLSAGALFAREMDEDEGPDSWPPWADAPVEFLDLDGFDDEGNLIAEAIGARSSADQVIARSLEDWDHAPPRPVHSLGDALDQEVS